MNISQHSVVMLGYDPGHYYPDSGAYSVSTGSTGTTLLAPTCGANTVIVYCAPYYSNVPFIYGGTLRVFKDSVRSGTTGQNVLLSKTNYNLENTDKIGKPVTLTNNEESCYAFSVSSQSSNYPMVTYVMYRDDSPVLNMLNLGNIFSSDVIDDEEVIG